MRLPNLLQTAASMRICAIKMWADFSLHEGFVSYLLKQAFGEFDIVSSEELADIVITSVFFGDRPRFPDKTIAIIWENIRPNYGLARFSISSDFDSYDGRNIRCPYWMSMLKWPYYFERYTEPGSFNHGFEPLVTIDDLLKERAISRAARDHFCCLVAGNPEGHRMLAAEALSGIDKVDMFGNVVRRPLRSSKFQLLANYRFNLCFENSIFPGYYTEKPVHAYAGGCVPLYFSDAFYKHDFNPLALVNRCEFATLDDFVAHVRKIEASPAAQEDIVSQPLLLAHPTIEPVVGFLRRARDSIKLSAPSSFAVPHLPPPSPQRGATNLTKPINTVRRNDPCPCGSGRKYKHCHGALLE